MSIMLHQRLLVALILKPKVVLLNERFRDLCELGSSLRYLCKKGGDLSGNESRHWK